MADTERSCLVIADISGYTGYLAGVELDHAQDVLADLMSTVVKSLRPSFKLAKLEGDAAFAYALTDVIDGSILLDTVESCYFAFRQRLVSIRQASTCQCSACALIPGLNLKVVAHHGTVAIHRIAGHSELVGTDVIIVHRLLKNSIPEPAYLFLTDACVESAALDPAALGMRRHQEEYEHLGQVGGWVEDLEQAWQAHRERKRTYISEKGAAFALSTFFPAPPELVWEYISSPIKRAMWSAGVERVDQLDPTGRRRPGTLNHCVHGENVVIQEFIDWRPPRYYTSKATLPGAGTFISTHEVEPARGGAILHDRFQRPKDKISLAMLDQLQQMMVGAYPVESERLRDLLLAELTGTAGESEPEIPQPDEGRRLATAVITP